MQQDAAHEIKQLTSQFANSMPEALAAALPTALAEAQQVLPSDAKGNRAVQVGSLSPDGQSQLRQLVAGEISQALQQMAAAQVGLGRMSVA